MTIERIDFKPNAKNCGGSGSIEFATNNAHTSHMNIYYTDVPGNSAQTSKSGCMCISPEEALAIRDALIRFYSLEDFPFKEKTVEVKFRVPVKNASLLNDAAKALKAEKIDG